MAELEQVPVSECCSAEAQADCCEPAEKDGCCAPASSTCGCSADQAGDADEVREAVRARYAAAAASVTSSGGDCCGSVDVVISNCVINLSGDKPRVLAEAAQVLRPGGRLAVSDVIAEESMDEATRADVARWTGCIAGALTRAEFKAALIAAGLVDVEIVETHRVHDHAVAAIVRARKPPSTL